MAGRDFSKFVRVMGGARGLADRVNTLRDKLNAARDQKPLTERTVYSWTPACFPMGWRQWVLAAALDAGMTQEDAIKLCPELKAAVALATFIAWRLEQKAAA